MKYRFSFFRDVTFVAIGAYIEEFLSEFIKSGIKTHNIHNDNGALYIRIRRKDYKKATLIARQFNIRIRVYEKHGLNLKSTKKKKYNGIFAGITLASLTVVYLQNFVWKIDIHGTDELSETLILNTIAKNGIVPGAYSSDLDTDSAEYATKLAISDISWINIEVNGSRVDVYLNEGKSIEKPDISTKTPCNVIAAKNGVIVETEVYSGTLLYNKGSGVSQGNVIVSGVVNDGADNLIMTHANAKIIADFTETVTFRQEYNTTERIMNKSYFQEKELMLFGFVIPLTEKVENHSNKICEEITSNCYLFGYELPWKIKINTYKEYEEVDVIRTNEDVNRILNQELELYCKNFLSEYEILDIARKTEYDEMGIMLTADISLRGNIALQQEIMHKTY